MNPVKAIDSLRLAVAIVLILSLISFGFHLSDTVAFKLFSRLGLYSAIELWGQEEALKEAYFYKKLDNQAVQCQLCPRGCVLTPGKRGFCQARQNRNGKLFSLVYGRPCSIHIDPIEKKPLFHFLPATPAFSVATVGCNLKCLFCQNWQISQVGPEAVSAAYIGPRELIDQVKQSGAPAIAYTYTEPTVFYEYMLDVAKLAHAEGIRNVMHSNGYINPEPLRELCRYLDAANIDLKGFRQKYYREMTQGNLDSVLESLIILKQEGIWVEITNLILPGLNDDKESITEMCLWIKNNLGSDVPLHFSRFHPMYKMLSLNPTPIATLEKAKAIAEACGLKYVYIGNVPGHAAESTYCPKCGKPVIRRSGYAILGVDLDEQGKCKNCQEGISGVWR